MTTTILNDSYNSRKRKPGTICAIVLDANGNMLDAIIPGDGTHKQAIEWAEWRAETIREEYPEVARLVVYVDDMEIGEVELPSQTPITAGLLDTTPDGDRVMGYIIYVIRGYSCNARELYGLCNAAREAWDIARALDGGTLDDIRREIISYMYLMCPDLYLHYIRMSRDDVNKSINKIDWLNE